ncbi:hypothetical protein J2Z83_002316 [Virgibacillus natechei]|uniref:Uncharacterized protein n=1 Tax=Virgibacillus natechei TaxID=1216297 RepID=A0ABS4IGX3_9BACI|nr:hypothetical protein [Virgibacillus natechei]
MLVFILKIGNDTLASSVQAGRKILAGKSVKLDRIEYK